jgi:putative nucleotidyltransferase with HDIG domain
VSTSNRPPLPVTGRALVCAVGLAGTLVATHSVASIQSAHVPEGWIWFSLLTLLSGLFTLKIPSIKARLSVSEIFAFSCVLLYGPELGAITVTVDALFLSLRRKHGVEFTTFNVGNLTLSVWLSGTLFFLAAGVAPLSSSNAPVGGLLAPLLVLVASYFAINSGLTASIVATEARRPPFEVWRAHFMPLAPTYAAGASVALLLVISLRSLHWGVIGLILPLVFISYLTMWSWFGRLEDSKEHVDKLNRMYLSTVETLATAIDAKDEVTHGHIRRVQAAAVGLARELGITDELTLKAIEAAALLHDTGKIAVPEHILNKPGKLTPAEFEKMKLHAPIGADILSSIDFPYPVVPIVRHHHENWDGTGYPDGLRGSDIPIGARILSVVDCFDALTSDRPYRSRMTNAAAVQILRERRGTMYDAEIVDVFIAAHERLMPTETLVHPAAKAVGGARAKEKTVVATAATTPQESQVADELLAVSSLARAAGGEATLADVGALAGMMLRPLLPSAAIALFVPDEQRDTVVGAFASGAHAGMLRGLTTSPGDGVVGWVAAHRRQAVNADPALDFGLHLASANPPLLSSLAIPLEHDGSLVAVLSVYATARGAFTDDHARLLDLLAPKLAVAVISARRNELVTSSSKTTTARAVGELRLMKGRRDFRAQTSSV